MLGTWSWTRELLHGSYHRAAGWPHACALQTFVVAFSDVHARGTSFFGTASCMSCFVSALLRPPFAEYYPAYGYFPNDAKSVLVVKPEHLQEAESLFADTAVQIRTDGWRHLGAVLGSPEFCKQYVTEKVETWALEIGRLADFATTQPQAAYAAFNHGLRHKWSFVARTVPGISGLLDPLEHSIRQRFIPALTSRPAPGDEERAILSLPCREGGLGLIDPRSLTDQYNMSVAVTNILVSRILDQDTNMDEVPTTIHAAKLTAAAATRRASRDQASQLLATCDVPTQRTLGMAAEKGASNWLTCRPLKQFGFVLHKGAFRDALCLRFGWVPPRLPSTCVCGKAFNTSHALSCPTGGYPALRHNTIRDLTADLLREVATDVKIEPPLQPLEGERLRYRSAILEDGARLDVAASGVWGSRFERTFCDVRVFNPHARSNTSSTPASTYAKHEQQKRRAYEERVREVEHASFLPLVFSASGGCGKVAHAFLKRLGHMVSEKRHEPYSSVMSWIRSLVSFALVRSCNMSLRGHRASPYRSRLDAATPVVLAVNDCQLRD